MDRDGGIAVLLKSDAPYEGKVVFDIPRHRRHIGFKRDWPRMNTLPEWFTVEADNHYTVHGLADAPATYSGKQLAEGLQVSLQPGEELQLTVTPVHY